MIKTRKIELCGKNGTVVLSADGTPNWICLKAEGNCTTRYNKSYYLNGNSDIRGIAILVIEILQGSCNPDVDYKDLSNVMNMVRNIIW